MADTIGLMGVRPCVPWAGHTFVGQTSTGGVRELQSFSFMWPSLQRRSECL